VTGEDEEALAAADDAPKTSIACTVPSVKSGSRPDREPPCPRSQASSPSITSQVTASGGKPACSDRDCEGLLALKVRYTSFTAHKPQPILGTYRSSERLQPPMPRD